MNLRFSIFHLQSSISPGVSKGFCFSAPEIAGALDFSHPNPHYRDSSLTSMSLFGRPCFCDRRIPLIGWSDCVEVKLEFNDIIYLGNRSLQVADAQTGVGWDREV